MFQTSTHKLKPEPWHRAARRVAWRFLPRKALAVLALPACLLGGGTLLLLADLAARTVAAPLQLPVGAVTAAIGAPVFLWLLARGTR